MAVLCLAGGYSHSSVIDVYKRQVPSRSGLPAGAVVMNANPFTLGHQYLIEKAASACSLLHLFIVSEDASLVPFPVRFQLVKDGISHLSNVVLHKTGSYLISNATFPSYFLKDEESAICSHARLDAVSYTHLDVYKRQHDVL